MEMFAVLAAQEENNDDVLRGLRIALDKIRNYRKVNAIFERFYTRAAVHPSVMKQRPLLLDPANPRNNLLGPEVHRYFDKLSSFADVTLQRLDTSERCGQLLPDLFAPQPNVWSSLPQNPVHGSWIVGSKSLSDEKQPRVVAQKPYVDVKTLEVAAHVIGCALVSKSGQFTKHDVEMAIDSILVGHSSNWGPTSRRFEDSDALAIFPIHDGKGTCVVAGFDVERSRG